MKQTYDYQTVMQDTTTLERWKTIALCAVCTQKVAPLIQMLALPATWTVVEASLALGWKAVIEAPSTFKQEYDLLDQLTKVPERQCEYPDTLSFFVNKPLDIVGSLLSLIVLDNTYKMAFGHVPFSPILEIAEELDVSAQTSPYGPLDSSLVGQEELSQLFLVSFLREQKDPSPFTITCLQSHAQFIAINMKRALPSYCFAFLRDLSSRSM